MLGMWYGPVETPFSLILRTWW